MSLIHMLIGFVIAEVVIALMIAPDIFLKLPQGAWLRLRSKFDVTRRLFGP
jgi:hypothetical protein